MIPITNYSLDNSEFPIDEENKSQIAEQLRSNRIANKPRIHYRQIYFYFILFKHINIGTKSTR